MINTFKTAALSAAMALSIGGSAVAQDCMIGEVRAFGGNFNPRTWALTDGQLLPINQNQALFSIIGTIYGGDGRTTFALPDLRSRSPVHPGSSPGLNPVNLGEISGAETRTLLGDNLPSHSHSLNAASGNGTTSNPAGTAAAKTGRDRDFTAFTEGGLDSLSISAMSSAGANQSFSIRDPYQSINYIICLQGIFPSRS